MWSHRGFAREIGAILSITMLPEDRFLKNLPVKHYKYNAIKSNSNSLNVNIENPDCCKRLAVLSLDQIENRSCNLYIAQRLAKVDSKPISTIIDITNYVMLDIGQPMHAFDKNAFKDDALQARFAKNSEKLKLLDGQDIILNDQDCVISNSRCAESLAGIMGGFSSGISRDTTQAILESANFDPTFIRLTAVRHKKRTEASARFEKSLDLNQNTNAIMRFLKIADDIDLKYKCNESIVSLGDLQKEKFVLIGHEYINKKLGAAVTSDFIVETLSKLGFGVSQSKDEQNHLIYEVTVPTFRATKDVAIKEDILEEIARFFGYTNIMPTLPVRQMAPFNVYSCFQKRKIKNFFAFSMNMHEASNYAFYDQEFLQELNFVPENGTSLANPISENWKMLVTSLIPNLIKAVKTNINYQDKLRFFEIGKIWNMCDKLHESNSIAGVCADKNGIDFYEEKSNIERFFKMLHMPIEFTKPKGASVWFDKHQVAEVMYDNKSLGLIGKGSKEFFKDKLHTDLFIFEFDLGYVADYKPAILKYKHISKYPAVTLDISMFVPLGLTVAEIEKSILSADKKIKAAHLVDFFEKENFNELRAVTFRFVLVDFEKTLTKSEIDETYQAVVDQMEQLGAAIR